MDNDGYFSDIAFFKKYNEYVDSYQNSNPKIYFFLKDCDFSAFTMKIKIAFLTMNSKTCVINSN